MACRRRKRIQLDDDDDRRRRRNTALIPGLPDEIGVQCLGRVSRLEHAAMKGVCRRWRDAIAHAATDLYAFRRLRRVEEPSMLHIRMRGQRRSRKIQVQATEVHLPSGAVRRHSVSIEESLHVVDFKAQHGLPEYDALWAGNGRVFLVSGAPRHACSYKLDVLGGQAKLRRVGPMAVPRESASYAVLGSFLYAAGGFIVADGAERCTVVERFDYRAHEWSRVADMPFAMDVRFSAVAGGRFVLVGVCAESGACDCVSYSPESDSWAVHGGESVDADMRAAPGGRRVVERSLTGPPDGRGNRVFRVLQRGPEKGAVLQTAVVRFGRRRGVFSRWKKVCRLLPADFCRFNYYVSGLGRVSAHGVGKRSCVVSSASCLYRDVVVRELPRRFPSWHRRCCRRSDVEVFCMRCEWRTGRDLVDQYDSTGVRPVALCY